MVTCTHQPLTMLPMVPINPFVAALKTSSAATPAAAITQASSIKTCVTTTVTNTTHVTAGGHVRPKLAFSIDALVGDDEQQKLNNNNKRIASDRSGDKYTSLAAFSANHDYSAAEPLELRGSKQRRLSLTECNNVYIKGERSNRLTPTNRDCSSPLCEQAQSPGPNESLHHSSRSSTPMQSPRAPNSPHEEQQHQQQQRVFKTNPLSLTNLPPGLVRPFPLQPPPNLPLIRPLASPGEPGHSAGHHAALLANAASASSPNGAAVPPPHLSHPPPPHPAALQGPTSNPHLLAAQFQMAAVLAHHQQQQQHQGAGPHPPPPPPPHPGLPPHLSHGHPLGLFPPHHPAFANPHIIRDSYPLYPWLMSRHGRIFSHRFPGFLLQPFRKPKRVRTAFSPTQLLKLEHAFEENHYVVGAERKQLAQTLSLTETQVKVWFQNRRTKHKRMQQEGDSSDTKSQKGSQSGDNDGKNDSSQTSFEDQDDLDDADVIDDDEEDEVIDMDDYDDMDVEERKRMAEHFQEMHSRHFAAHSQMLQQQNQQHHQFLQQQHFLQQHQQLYAQNELHRQQQLQQQHHQHHEQSNERVNSHGPSMAQPSPASTTPQQSPHPHTSQTSAQDQQQQQQHQQQTKH